MSEKQKGEMKGVEALEHSLQRATALDAIKKAFRLPVDASFAECRDALMKNNQRVDCPATSGDNWMHCGYSTHITSYVCPSENGLLIKRNLGCECGYEGGLDEFFISE